LDKVALALGERAGTVLDGISAGALAGDTLFVASDETASIEALARDGDGWRFQATYKLKELIDLPGGDENEADLEALWATDNWLWLVGSHARVRRKPDDDDGPKKSLRKLAEIDRPSNRFVLARVPLTDLGGGIAGLDRKTDNRQTEQIEAGKRSSALMKWIEDDAMLAPFLALPSKEGGFDIEGMTAHSGLCWLGLRGPVIRDHAVVLQFQMSGAKRGALKAKKLDDGRRFRKFLLPLDGLGVRDLAVLGEDILVVAGPPGNAPGPSRLYRWVAAREQRDSHVVDPKAIHLIVELGASDGCDNAEAVLPIDAYSALILYDRPAPERLDHETGVYTADLVRFGKY